MKVLAVAGTAAMFLVGGGIVVHGLPVLHHALAGSGVVVGLLADAVVGIVVGALVLAAVSLGAKLWAIFRKP
jgi:predicted DNA repair protein MutK